jgi:hypothetical protein
MNTSALAFKNVYWITSISKQNSHLTPILIKLYNTLRHSAPCKIVKSAPVAQQLKNNTRVLGVSKTKLSLSFFRSLSLSLSLWLYSPFGLLSLF